MARAATANNHPQRIRERETRETRQGAIRNSLRLVVSLLGWMAMALLLNIMIELVGIWLDWWDLPGSSHARFVLQQELDWLNNDFRSAIGDPLSVAVAAGQSFYDWVWVWGGKDMGQVILGSVGSGSVYDWIRATIWVTQVFAVRLVVMLFSMPIFLAFGIVALTDGLLQRDLRRFGGGRESGYIWHHAMKAVRPTVILPIVIYLGLPFSIHPNLIVLPFAILFSISLWIGAAWFKKYL